jgi:putative redox protein
MGGELFLASVGGCFMSNLLAAITARGSDVSGVRTEVTGTLDGVPSHFVGIQLQVSADRAGREEFAKLVEIADRACIMTNTLREALDVTVNVAAISDTGL